MKQVLWKGGSDHPVPQVALGKFRQGEQSGQHAHPSMDEFFFVLKGVVFAQFVDNDAVLLYPGDLLHVSATTVHNIGCAPESLEAQFIYWGVVR